MHVRVYAGLRKIVGGKVVDLSCGPGDTFQQMVDELLVRWPDLGPELIDADGELLSDIHIFLDGQDMRHDDLLEQTIPGYADIRIFPPVG